MAVALGTLGLGIQAAVDIYQAVNPAMDWPTWLLQAWQMSLPTGFTMAFAGIGGCLLYARRWFVALILYALVGCYMAYTASNSMDFVSNQTVAHTRAALTREADIKSIVDLQNETAKEERKEATKELWRTYATAKTQSDRDKTLLKIEEITSKPLALQQTEVRVSKVGTGGILNRWMGWSPESVQEAKAVAFPILVMIGKALGITLGFAFWPPSTAAAERWRSQPPKPGKFPTGMEIERKVTKDEARNDIIKACQTNARIESGRELADRWGVTESCASKWLRDFRKEGIIRRERRGKFMTVQAAPSSVIAINGNGRAHA